MNKLFVLLSFVSVLAFNRAAHATHKNWVLKDAGNHCAFASPNPEYEYYTDTLTNLGPDGRMVECPVSLAGRWGASAPLAFAPPRWANSMWGNVYVENYTPMNVICEAAATMSSGLLYWGNPVSSAGQTGVITLPVNNNNTWGGSLQTHQTETVKSLVYECSLPQSANVKGYKVKICQINTTCADLNSNDQGIDARESESYVQESGLNCSGNLNEFNSNYVPNFSRGLNGITNTSPIWSPLWCALTPPADDSYEHQRILKHTRVYYTGGARNSTCVDDGTCPSCVLSWNRRSATDPTGYTTSHFNFATDSSGRSYLEQPAGETVNLGIETDVVVHCQTAPGTTINGITSSMSTTRNSGGI